MQYFPRRRRLTFALAVVAAGLGLAGTASASVPGIERVEASSGTDSFSPKNATVLCPSGKQLVGVGGEITGGFGEISMTEVMPNGLNRAVVTAEEDADGSARQWRVTAYAMCANPIAGSHIVSGIRTNAFEDKTARASCPAGEKILSVGGRVSGAEAGRAVMTGLTYPSSTLGDVRGQETQAGTDRTWSVEALAICAPPLPGMVRGEKFSAFDSLNPKTRGIGCPPGTNLLGGGGSASGAGQVVLDDLRPSPTGFTALAREDQDGFAPNWMLTAGAICA